MTDLQQKAREWLRPKRAEYASVLDYDLDLEQVAQLLADFSAEQNRELVARQHKVVTELHRNWEAAEARVRVLEEALTLLDISESALAWNGMDPIPCPSTEGPHGEPSDYVIASPMVHSRPLRPCRAHLASYLNGTTWFARKVALEGKK